MDLLLLYIKNIGFFLILVSVVCNALPENSYKKYCKLFCGLVLVVLVLNPFNEFLNNEGDISDIFANKLYQSEMLELEAGLKMMEEEQMQIALDCYEEELKETLKKITDEEGLKILDVDVVYKEEDNELKLQGIHIYGTNTIKIDDIEENNSLADDKDINSNENISGSIDINLDEIHIDDIEIDSYKGGDNGNSIDKLSPGDRPKALKIIEKVAELLGIETYMISVTIK